MHYFNVLSDFAQKWILSSMNFIVCLKNNLLVKLCGVVKKKITFCQQVCEINFLRSFILTF